MVAGYVFLPAMKAPCKLLTGKPGWLADSVHTIETRFTLLVLKYLCWYK